MGKTSIEWTAYPNAQGVTVPGYTFNAWLGCDRVSPACVRCYIVRTPPFLFRKLKHGNSRERTAESTWAQPLAWEHDFIDEGVAPVAEGVGHDVAAFNASDGVFDGDPHFAGELVDGLLDRMEFASTRLLFGLEGVGPLWFVALEAGVFDHQRVGRVRQPTFIGQLLVVDAAGLVGPRYTTRFSLESSRFFLRWAFFLPL